MCLVYLSLYCTQHLCVPLFLTYTTITITITACSIFFSHNYLLFCSQLRSSKHDFVYTQLHTSLTEFLPTAVFYSPTRSVKRIFLKQKMRVLAFSRTLFRVCNRILAPLTCLLFLVYLKHVRCIC